ncbi:MAG: signal peptidase II [Thermodesulfobacteriota bacterium]
MPAKYRKLLIVAFLIVGLDQLTKVLVVNTMRLYESIPVIPGFFNLTYIHNPGGAFGFMAGQSQTVRVLLFVVVSLLAVGFIFYFYQNTPESHPMLATGFALIFGGAIGNLIDRIRIGTVIDFLDVYVNQWHWPAFNVADSAISIGMAIFLYHLLFKKMPV